MTTRGAMDRVKQANAFIVAQRMHAQTCKSCNLLDSEFCFHILSVQLRARSKSSLQTEQSLDIAVIDEFTLE